MTKKIKKPVSKKETAKDKPEVVKPDSSNIKEYIYNQDKGELLITFHHGGTYKYEAVPYKMFLAMKVAESAGSFFNQYIKNNNSFKTTKL